MVMIGEESNVRDRPIYLQVWDNTKSYSFWFVIEEKDDDGIEEEEIHHKNKKKRKQIQDDEIQKDDRIEESSEEEESEKSESESEKSVNSEEESSEEESLEEDEEGEIHQEKRKIKDISIISVLKPSETDEIRELLLPYVNFYKSRLVVFNSRVYLFGGFGRRSKKSETMVVHSRNAIYLDTKDRDPERRWLTGPTLNVRGRTLSVAAIENSGLFIAFGKNARNEFFAEFLYDSLNGEWRPSPPIPEPERFQIDNARLLAVTDTKVYIHGIGEHYRMGLSFDIKNSEWNIFDRSFHGSWSPGVVLEFCSKSYLFSFGLPGLEYRLKLTPPIHTQQLWVYDLNNCTWLPLPVQGISDDGTFFPHPHKNRYARNFLFQMNQRNKLAFIWSRPLFDCYTITTEIHCIKFIIDCTTDSNSQHPIFRAKIVSSGSYDIKNLGPLLNCAPSLIGKDKEEVSLLEEETEN